MRRTRHVVAACALGTALLVPAIPLAAQEAAQPAPDAPRPTLTSGNVRPDAALTSTQSGGKVTFDASKSIDSDGSIVSYEWDLDGDSVYETKTAGEPRAEHSYDPGTTLIAAVRVTDDAGASDEATAPVVVAGDAGTTEPGTSAPASAAPAEPAVPLVPTTNLDQPAAQPHAVKSSREEGGSDEDDADAKSDPTVVAAANGAVTIKDFEFVPTTVNVTVGDSVTWLNQGPTAHTATANDGSFDSGTLAKGKSYSHKFTKAGTFSYFCKPHPFMKAKIVVTGAGSSGSGSGGSGSSGSGSDSGSSGDSGTAGASADSGSGDSLARTGVDLLPWTLFAISLVAFGAALRYRLIED